MLIRVPDYYEAFHCLAGACPHTCCEKWEVVIDPETARRYGTVPGPLGERLRAAMGPDEDGDLCFRLDGGRCPFLDRENLCEIHRALGEAATSVTCREHPRFTEDYGPFRETSLCASCPAACDLLLGSDAPLTFLTRETAEPAEPGDPWLRGLLPLRERLLRELADRSQPLEKRLETFLLLATEAQVLLDADQAEELPALAAHWKQPETAVPPGPGLFPYTLEVLAGLEALDAVSYTHLDVYKRQGFAVGAHCAPGLFQNFLISHDISPPNVFPKAAVCRGRWFDCTPVGRKRQPLAENFSPWRGSAKKFLDSCSAGGDLPSIWAEGPDLEAGP